LGEKVAAEGDAAIESDGRKVGATAALGFDPRTAGRYKARQICSNKVEQAEIGADSADCAAILRSIRAQVQELGDAGKVLAGGSMRQPGDIENLG